MTSILKVDTIQDADGNNIINESGNTITIGASGDTTNIIGTLQNDGAAVGGTNTPAFQAFLSSNQSIGHASATKIQFNTEVFDTASAYDNSTNYRFTVPSGQGGKYYIYAAVRPNTTTDIDSTHIYVYKNGAERLQSSGRTEYYETLNCAMVDDLSVGDYLEVYYYQASGGSIDVSGNASVLRTRFGAYKIIE